MQHILAPRARPAALIAAVAGVITLAGAGCRDDSPEAQRRIGRVPAAAETASQADHEQGEQIFGASCAVCHGPSGEGDVGPDLTGMTDASAVETQVRNGGGGMPPFEGQLTDEEIEAVTAYVTDVLAGGTD